MGPEDWVGEAEQIAAFISDTVRGAGAGGVVLGLSGGLDSALAARLAIMALGPGRVLSVHLPCHPHGADDEGCAARLAALWGIEHRVIPIDGMVDAASAALSVGDDRLALGNIMARARMTVLYHIARREGLLVLGTGNRSEIMMGYFTKHGDGACDLQPIAGLFKTEVREMSRHLGVPEQLLRKEPSAGLWEGQTDEGDMGMGYDELDRLLAALSEGLDDEEAAIRSGGSRESAASVRRRVDAGLHKSRMPPRPGP